MDKGLLSIESRNIFAILKKWLYAETDVAFRELISNALDAIEKRGQESKSSGAVTVRLDNDEKRIIISDNGIGMTQDEVHKYINQIAFSGAEDYISRGEGGSIIGHFGVGFYSAFMLAEHVAIETKADNSPAVRWDCTADMAYSMAECDKKDTGTDVILYLDDGSPYLTKPELITQSVKKYFALSKTPVRVGDVTVGGPLADADALYPEMFGREPPIFNLKFASLDIGLSGVLFFRNTRGGTEELDGKLKFYSRGVYIGDNLPGYVPKFIGLQNGIIECDDLELVVSRSGVREEDGENMAKLVSECLSQEAAIFMNDMYQNRRQDYERFWPEISAFVKYGALQDKIFASVMSRKVLFEDINGKYSTVTEHAAEKDTVFYASDKLDQAHYIGIFKRCGLNALLFDHVIDKPLLIKYSTLYPKLKFIRIDSDDGAVYGNVPEPGDDEKERLLRDKAEKALGERLGDMELRVTRLRHESVSALIVNDEQSRRMADMMEIYGFISAEDYAEREKQSKSALLLNLGNETVRFTLETADEAAARLVLEHLFDLALLGQQALKPEDMEGFIARTEKLLKAYTK